ncbi:MAG: hypothetical protein QOI10_1714 [Solirubrobacterales bacterium]|jgi:short subunit dehydrogenase-like uncharacterized protein|nr:hypothetical protein [Solirubrobacterales bacterium]
MSGRIILFGATGYTGRLTAEASVARGDRPVLAARTRDKVEALAAELGGLETAVADVSDPASVRALLEPGDVIVATVGPFVRWGDVAAEAAIAAGARYLDSTGEPAFIRRVFERFGPEAERSGAALVTAFGYDWVPGNLAGALALREAGGAATRVDIGYFATGGLGGMSGGTRASAAGAMLEPSFVWRDGIRTERAAARVREFELDGRSKPGISVGSSEHFTLPRIHPGLQEVNTYLGWFGSRSRPMAALSAFNAGITRIPGVKAGMNALIGRAVKTSTGGPDTEARAATGSEIVAIAYGPGGEELSRVEVRGVNGYTFTGAALAWGAATAAAGGIEKPGALGPAEAFGLDVLEAGCAEAGITRV